jgi:hypothetical protein
MLVDPELVFGGGGVVFGWRRSTLNQSFVVLTERLDLAVLDTTESYTLSSLLVSLCLSNNGIRTPHQFRHAYS